MKHTFQINIGRKHSLFPYAKQLTADSVRLYNRALFLQRNLMTGIQKDQSQRHLLEQEAIDTILSGIRIHNADPNATSYPEPDENHWLLSAYEMTTILQATNDPDYYRLPGQVNQRVAASACQSFKNFLNAVKAYKKDPSAFTGRPKLPGYRTQQHMTVSFSSQVCKIKKDKTGRQFLKFPKTDRLLCLGHLDLKGKLQAVTIVPEGNSYKVCVMTEDGLPEPEIRPKGERFYALDPGIGNFMTVTGNFKMQPFVLDGKFLKSLNRLYNKTMAKLQADLMRGTGTSKRKPVLQTHRMKQTTVRRARQFRDIFYKYAHFLCRKAKADDVDMIIYGWNTGIKQKIRIGDANDQNFAQIPYRQFFRILKEVAFEYGIAVVEQEESYTSQASFLDMDEIPVYGQKAVEGTVFSGRRISRSTYRSKNGTVLNADVNGSLNILRKYQPDAFAEMEDFSCFLRTIRRYGFDAVYCRKKHKGIVPKAHSGSQAVPVLQGHSVLPESA